MAKEKVQTPATEVIPLAVIERDPSDAELISELSALQFILNKRAMKRMEFGHAADSLGNAIMWIAKGAKA